jgi:glycosyltransferase involved in cell wall biosynthesis
VPGRLSRSKGHIHVIETIKKLRSNSVTCLIVGDDKGHFEYRQELQNLIDSSGLSRRVIITSSVTDMPAMYALSDIVISASTKPESLGLVSIEAQAMGRMMIATSIGGSRETIINGQTGWLVEPGNPEAMKVAIEEALALDLPKRLYRAKLARNHVERHFSLDSMREKMLHIYGYLLE